MQLRTIAAAAAVTAMTLGLGTAGAANAQTAAASSCVGWYQVGESENYNAYGMVAGNISELYDGCGDVKAQWIWNYSFVQQHPQSVVRVTIGSSGYNGGAPITPYGFSTAYTTATYGYAVYSYYEYTSIYSASNEKWRAGAEIDYSGCAAWTSEHYYGNGSETAGPYGGCGDWGNVSQIPWTQP